MELEDPATSTCCLTTQVSQRGSADVQQSADTVALCLDGRGWGWEGRWVSQKKPRQLGG